MLRTVEAMIDKNGKVRLRRMRAIRLTRKTFASLVTILEDDFDGA